MHFIQLVDSLVLLFPQPLTIHRLHPFYHQLRASQSLAEAESILARTYTNLYYLHDYPCIVEHPSGKLIFGKQESGNLLAVFTSIEECYSTYPELFI